jgi:hypothetical protein
LLRSLPVCRVADERAEHGPPRKRRAATCGLQLSRWEVCCWQPGGVAVVESKPTVLTVKPVLPRTRYARAQADRGDSVPAIEGPEGAQHEDLDEDDGLEDALAEVMGDFRPDEEGSSEDLRDGCLGEYPEDHLLDDEGFDDMEADHEKTATQVVVEEVGHVVRPSLNSESSVIVPFDDSQEMLDAIAAQAKVLVEGLTDARRLAEESCAQPLRNQDISLVSKGDVVTLVYWTDVRCKEGRRLGINHNNTIKALVHAKIVVESFAGARVIVHRVPAIILMRKGRQAFPLPAWCLSLLEVEQCQQFAGPLDEPPAKCQRCAELKRRGMENTKHGLDMYCCQSCGGFWHRECAL